MITLLKNCDLYAPQSCGLNDILIAGEKIEAVAPAGSRFFGIFSSSEVEVRDLKGKKVTPGLIDIHVHVTGGGGEQGFASRVPESRMEDIAATGVTTVLGLLGTDGVTRSLENLYAKVMALNEEGISAYMLTGSYALPSTTLTGSVERDIALIGPCIGLKLAMSDHRSSHPDGRMLTDAASAARMGGLISGKKGLVTIHTGNGEGKLSPVFEMLRHSDVPIGNILPTHMGRNRSLFEDGLELIRMGGNIDLTGSEGGEASDWIFSAIEKGIDCSHITLSSDGYGSQPKFDETGACIGLTWSKTDVLLCELKKMTGAGLPLSTALSFVTENAAARLGLESRKGRIAAGMDADLTVMDEDLEIFGVIARGTILRWDHAAVRKGYFS